ncbi:MAG: hypothetical protein LBC53_04880 [Spirochaetaceae bacterium]|jgi:NAD(P)H-flavin reductase|nr:hypothetical protein [Spirochaetaceae bacterium]
MTHNKKSSLLCSLHSNLQLTNEAFLLTFNYAGPIPSGGQFFLVKPVLSPVFLPRPFCAFDFKETEGGERRISFLIARRGAGAQALCAMASGQDAVITGPLGNCWEEAASGAVKNGAGGRAAIVCGGVGIAAFNLWILETLKQEKKYFKFIDFYGGFKTEPFAFLSIAQKIEKAGGSVVIASENPACNLKYQDLNFNIQNGVATDFIDFKKYTAVFACGPLPLLKKAAAECAGNNVSCFVSLEKKMACGVGACLGCAINGKSGSKRICADGPIFDAKEMFL